MCPSHRLIPTGWRKGIEDAAAGSADSARNTGDGKVILYMVLVPQEAHPARHRPAVAWMGLLAHRLSVIRKRPRATRISTGVGGRDGSFARQDRPLDRPPSGARDRMMAVTRLPIPSQRYPVLRARSDLAMSITSFPVS